MRRKTKVGIVLVITATLMLSACTPNQIQMAEQLALVLVQDIPQFIVLFGNPSKGTVNIMDTAVADATQSAALLQQAIADFKTAGPTTTAEKVHFYVNEIDKDLKPILAMTGGNQKLAAAITLAITTAEQIDAVFPVSPTPAAVKATNRVRLPNPKDVDKKFHALFGY